MCLGIPGKVVETYRDDDVLMGRVDFGGIQKRVCLEHVPEAKPSVLGHMSCPKFDAHCTTDPRPQESPSVPRHTNPWRCRRCSRRR